MFYTASTFFFDILQAINGISPWVWSYGNTWINKAGKGPSFLFSLIFFFLRGITSTISVEETSYGYFACETVETKSINTGHAVIYEPIYLHFLCPGDSWMLLIKDALMFDFKLPWVLASWSCMSAGRRMGVIED
jgi:hypothetical protein